MWHNYNSVGCLIQIIGNHILTWKRQSTPVKTKKLLAEAASVVRVGAQKGQL